MTGSEVVITCGSCGSAGVTRDAVVRWGIEAQDWEVTNVFDNGDCDVCGGEASLEETPLLDWKKVQGTDHWVEMPSYEYEVRAASIGCDEWKAEASNCYEDTILTDDKVFNDDEEARDHARALALHRIFS